MPIARRSAQSKTGVTIRTRKGSPIFAETSPQNAQPFGADNITAGAAGGNFFAAPGAGFCWVVTSLTVTFNVVAGGGGRVVFTGGMAAVSGAGSVITLLNAPTAMPANSAFGYSSTNIGTSGTTFSVSGSAYKATVGSVFNAQGAQVVATTIDSDPAADLG